MGRFEPLCRLWPSESIQMAISNLVDKRRHYARHIFLATTNTCDNLSND